MWPKLGCNLCCVPSLKRGKPSCVTGVLEPGLWVLGFDHLKGTPSRGGPEGSSPEAGPWAAVLLQASTLKPDRSVWPQLRLPSFNYKETTAITVHVCSSDLDSRFRAAATFSPIEIEELDFEVSAHWVINSIKNVNLLPGWNLLQQETKSSVDSKTLLREVSVASSGCHLVTAISRSSKESGSGKWSATNSSLRLCVTGSGLSEKQRVDASCQGITWPLCYCPSCVLSTWRPLEA